MSPIPTRFFLGALAGLLLAAGAFCGIVLGQMGAPTGNSTWAATIDTRKLAAARAVAGPRLLIVGGSGALFGVKARQLETELAIPTINLASHAALGTSFILELPRRVARAGDTILLIPEYELYDSGDATIRTWADPVYLDFMMAAEPARFRQLPLRDFVALALRIPASRLVEGWRARLHPPQPRTFTGYHPYDPANVDDHGDMTGHRAARLPEKSRGPLGCSEALAHGLTAERSGMHDLRGFCEWAKQHEIRVVAALPVLSQHADYAGPAAAGTAAAVVSFWQSIGIPLLGGFDETLLPRSEFFDTSYHLTEEASATRTAQLATALAPYFRGPGEIR